MVHNIVREYGKNVLMHLVYMWLLLAGGERSL